MIKKRRKLQGLLGEHQDSIVAADFMCSEDTRIGVRSGHNGFSYGLSTPEFERRSDLSRAPLLEHHSPSFVDPWRLVGLAGLSMVRRWRPGRSAECWRRSFPR
jgi:hypothetical protein